jgi:hypothetical protein
MKDIEEEERQRQLEEQMNLKQILNIRTFDEIQAELSQRPSFYELTNE